MNTEFDGDDEASSRGNCVPIASEPKREQDSDSFGFAISLTELRLSQGITPDRSKKPDIYWFAPLACGDRILAEKTSYVRRSEFVVFIAGDRQKPRTAACCRSRLSARVFAWVSAL